MAADGRPKLDLKIMFLHAIFDSRPRMITYHIVVRLSTKVLHYACSIIPEGKIHRSEQKLVSSTVLVLPVSNSNGGYEWHCLALLYLELCKWGRCCIRGHLQKRRKHIIIELEWLRPQNMEMVIKISVVELPERFCSKFCCCLWFRLDWMHWSGLPLYFVGGDTSNVSNHNAAPILHLK